MVTGAAADLDAAVQVNGPVWSLFSLVNPEPSHCFIFGAQLFYGEAIP